MCREIKIKQNDAILMIKKLNEIGGEESKYLIDLLTNKLFVKPEPGLKSEERIKVRLNTLIPNERAVFTLTVSDLECLYDTIIFMKGINKEDKLSIEFENFFKTSKEKVEIEDYFCFIGNDMTEVVIIEFIDRNMRLCINCNKSKKKTQLLIRPIKFATPKMSYIMGVLGNIIEAEKFCKEALNSYKMRDIIKHYK